MAGFTDTVERQILDDTLGVTLYAALLVNDAADGSKDGTTWTDAGAPPAGTSEPTGVANYARIQVDAADWDAATGTAPASKSTNATIQWTATGGDYGEVIAIGLFDALTGGNLVWSAPTTLSNGTPTHTSVTDGTVFGPTAANPIKAQLGDPSDSFG